MTNTIINESPEPKELHYSQTISFAFLVAIFLYAGLTQFFVAAVFDHAPDTAHAYTRYNELCPVESLNNPLLFGTDAIGAAIANQCLARGDDPSMVRFGLMAFLGMLVNCTVALFDRGVGRFERVVRVRRVVLSAIGAGAFWWLYEAMPTVADRVATMEGMQSGAIAVQSHPALMSMEWCFPLYPVAGVVLLSGFVFWLMRFIAREPK
jgi:hypothetical protein